MAPNHLRTVDPELPVPSTADRFRKAANAARSLHVTFLVDGLEDADLEAQEAWLAGYARVQPTLPSLKAELVALSQPATRPQVATALLTLRDTIPPTSGRPATATGNRMMAERVGAREPSIGALNFATLQAIDTLEWYPPPAKMLGMLDEATNYLVSISNTIDRLPEIERQLAKRVAHERQRRVEIAERLRLLRKGDAA